MSIAYKGGFDVDGNPSTEEEASNTINMEENMNNMFIKLMLQNYYALYYQITLSTNTYYHGE